MREPLRVALAEAIAAEEAAGWAFLRRVPSTATGKAIDYLARVDPVERAAHAEAVIADAVALFSREAPAPSADHAAALGRVRAAMALRGPEREATIEPAAATEIRRHLETRLANRYGATTEPIDGAAFRHPGRWRDQAFELWIDYGGPGDQLRYGVGDPLEDRRRRRSRVAYETLLGVGAGHWDLVTPANLDASLDLLCTLVERVVELRRLVSW